MTSKMNTLTVYYDDGKSHDFTTQHSDLTEAFLDRVHHYGVPRSGVRVKLHINVDNEHKKVIESKLVEGRLPMNKPGKQTELSTRWDLLPPSALYHVASTLYEGALKYDSIDVINGSENWRRILPTDHVNHALQHIFAALSSVKYLDKTELSHAVCRLLFALDLKHVVNFTDGNDNDNP